MKQLTCRMVVEEWSAEEGVFIIRENKFVPIEKITRHFLYAEGKRFNKKTGEQVSSSVSWNKFVYRIVV